jgi:preprotein translocase subunit SecB
MLQAAFSIVNYRFDQFEMDFTLRESNTEVLSIEFNTEGVFNSKESIYELIFRVNIFSGEDIENRIMTIRCVGDFKIDNAKELKDIPDFFYINSVAILFPYVRAYISLVTTQANVRGIILPTYNLTSLEEGLRKNTVIK